ncbi:unnamed protein product [Darwinula stevensoni]|uniref:BRK domain-containing protein n=1 Tax=Darwinula stevensoni TaxID=69355 RepID=A0A7R9A281_9CRUS|nr:unnamed protein product [Darwinula stevensoni]CAG0889163.1 unnamed protein product [Darwinula stevensoni]
MGLSTSIPRGRKKRKRECRSSAAYEGDWSQDEKYDSEVYLDPIYRKHANRQANKVLLRVRLLYFIQQEVIGECGPLVVAGTHHTELPVIPPPCDSPPVSWWDSEADKCLLLGVYKHGYERFNVMRMDPCLCFLARCGPPDGAAVLAEMTNGQVILFQPPLCSGGDEDGDKTSAGGALDEEEESLAESTSTRDESTSVSATATPTPTPTPTSVGEEGRFPFPSATDLNNRIRRLVTCYQRSYKKEEMRLAARARRMERQERMEALVRERELKRLELQQRRWSKREEAEFQRVIASYGVDYDRKEKRLDWTRFRQLAHLDRKYDDTLNEYYHAFMAMCKRMGGRKLTPEEVELLQMVVEPIPEDRARRTLETMELLIRVREEILPDPKLEEKLRDLCQVSGDLPDWWICGKHDLDLLLGVARHGFSRTDYYLLNDPTLSFKDVLRRFMSGEPLLDEALKNKWKPEEKKGRAKEKREERNKGKEKEAKGQNGQELVKELEEEEKVTNKDIDEKVEEEKEVEENSEKGDRSEDKDCVEKQDVDMKEIDDADKIDEEVAEKQEDQVAENRNIAKAEEEEEETDKDVDAGKVKLEGTEKDVIGKAEEEGTEKDVVIGKAMEEGTEKDVIIKKAKEETEKDAVIEKAKEEGTEKESGKVNEEHVQEGCVAVKMEESGTESEGKVLKKEKEEKLIAKNPALSAAVGISLDFSQPLLSLAQMDEAIGRQSYFSSDPYGDPLLSHASTFGQAIRWPRDRILQIRVEHISKALETDEWPVPKGYTSGSIDSTPDATPRRDTSTPMSSAKLRALLNFHHLSMLSPSGTTASPRSVLEEEPRVPATREPLSSPSHQQQQIQLQPPPAHQHPKTTVLAHMPSGMLDLSMKSTSNTNAASPSATGSSSTPVLTSSAPMDLSSFSKQSSGSHASKNLKEARSSAAGSKLQDTLDKLRQRKMESVTSSPEKEKKRKKLDQIVMGLCAAKGGNSALGKGGNEDQAEGCKSPWGSVSQKEGKEKGKNLGDLGRSSVTITPIPQSRSSSEHLKMESKEAKVNRWLAEQLHITPDRPSSPSSWLDGSRRSMASPGLTGNNTTSAVGRRPRVDPNALDWNRLTGEENVAVINRLTGKKITGGKAPQLKHLAQWLLDNPMFDVDPKWAELVRLKGNLPDDLQRRISLEKKKGPGFSMPSIPTLGDLSSLAESAAAVGAVSSTTGSHSRDKDKSGKGSGTGSNPMSSFLFPPPGFMYNPLALGTMGGFSLPPGFPSTLLNGLNPCSVSSSSAMGSLSSLHSMAKSGSTSALTSSIPDFHMGSGKYQSGTKSSRTSTTTAHPSIAATCLSAASSHSHNQKTGNSGPGRSGVTVATGDSDDESLKSLMGNHDDDDDLGPEESESENKNVERVVLKESKDLEKEVEEQRRNLLREIRGERSGLTKEERNLLREKKKERLLKERTSPRGEKGKHRHDAPT